MYYIHSLLYGTVNTEKFYLLFHIFYPTRNESDKEVPNKATVMKFETGDKEKPRRHRKSKQ